MPQEWKLLFNGRNLDGWQPLFPDRPNEWQVVASIKPDAATPELFRIEPLPAGAHSAGILVNGAKGKTVNLITSEQHGDIEAEIGFMVPKGSNSGVYFMGLYEIQILDSFAKTELQFSDCGGVYARYINNQTVGGAPPRVNASRPPGEWQSFQVWFRAPRFDASGRKVENARFLKVLHNGITVHENVDVDGPTRAAMNKPEAPVGPLMIQGDHGPVAFGLIRIRPLGEVLR